MATFSINAHTHIDSAVLAVVLTFLAYAVKWLVEFNFPELIFFLPAFIVVFLGFYIVLWLFPAIAWSGK
jgi:hypothetical protein